MIVYRLKCADGHEFDSWFKDSGAYEALSKKGQVSCPACGCLSVSKAIMAPNIAKKASAPLRPEPAEKKEESPAELLSKMEVLARRLRKHVTDNFENVGNRFASEARKIHDGEAEERGIYGEAKPQEVKELLEDGIGVLPLPDAPDKAN